jgi:hypothetical protein
MKSVSYLVPLILLIPACGGSSSTPSVRDPQAAQKVATARARWDAHQKEFDSAPADARRKCEMRAGDCLMQLDEHRNDFVADNYVAECRDLPDSTQEATCVANALSAAGQPKAPVAYYEFGAWCYEKLNACTAELSNEAADEARAARIAARKDEIEFSPEAIDARSKASFAEERISYIRSTLPPSADGVCSEQAVRTKCEAEVQIKQERLAAKMEEDESYDRAGTLALYKEVYDAEAACYDPEFTCLNAGLARYGEVMASKAKLEKNFEKLQRREYLRAQVDETTGEQCLMEGVSQHQSGIIEGYQAYVDQPVMFFRSRLHDAFLQLHQAQIRCLEKAANEARAMRSPKVVPADGKASQRFGG